jgi:hypothetical protein
MTTGAIDALHADREAILKIGAGLTDADWAAASGCPRWSAKDVVAHMAALPQQNAGILAALTGGVQISVTGPAARTIQLGPGEPVAEIRSEVPALVRWITQRGDWEQLGVTACGDERQLCVAAGLKVF